MIRFTCQCGKQYQVSEKYAGKKVRCKKCSSILIAPGLVKADETAVGIIIENSSAKVVDSVQVNTNELTDAKIIKRIVITTVAIIGVLILTLISILFYKDATKKKQQQIIAEMIKTSVANADKYAANYDYAGALQQIDTVADQINSYKYVTVNDKGMLNDKKCELIKNRAAFDKKIASGYVVFEGGLILRTEQNKILAEREMVRQDQEKAVAESKRKHMEEFIKVISTKEDCEDERVSSFIFNLDTAYYDVYDKETLPYHINQICKGINFQIRGVYVMLEDANEERYYFRFGKCYKFKNREYGIRSGDELNGLHPKAYSMIISINPEVFEQEVYIGLPDHKQEEIKDGFEYAAMDYIKTKGYADFCKYCMVLINTEEGEFARKHR